MKTAIIIGAGPAGLTAAFELLKRTDIKPIILERSSDIGGISKTVRYKGNGIDIGGHRFFSKSNRVMNWWLNIMPVEDTSGDIVLTYRGKSAPLPFQYMGKPATGADSMKMLVRNRLSRIYYMRKLFSYPLSISLHTVRQLGYRKVITVLLSYLHARLFYRKKAATLEDFFIRRFGKVLYHTFFKEYTEKVWGVPCSRISAEWGEQRIKKLSITKALLHASRQLVTSKRTDINQKGIETSLIERFLYPKLGPGQLWEEVARQVVEMGGEIHLGCKVDEIMPGADGITAVACTVAGGTCQRFAGDYFFSTMPVKDLIEAIKTPVPDAVRAIAAGLQYRDFITVGLLLTQLKITDANGYPVRDNWIYIQEPGVKIGRLQIFNNWSPHLLSDPSKSWIGLEYFCNEGDELWRMPDKAFIAFAIGELQSIGIIDSADVLDSTLIRMEKTYPAYFGTYHDFGVIRNYVDSIPNLFLIGRNGMHKYNNSDHSMLTAMTAVDNIIQNRTNKDNVWDINTEQEYHESK